MSPDQRGPKDVKIDFHFHNIYLCISVGVYLCSLD